MLIGKRIKEIREKKNMTLLELSKKSGVQIASLSRIENLKMVGTIGSHIAVANALGVELIELYDNATAFDPHAPTLQFNKPKSGVETFTYNERASYEILTGQLLKKKMLPIVLRIESGGRTNPEQNQPGSERFLFVLEGEITAHIGEETFTLKANSSLYFNAGVEHWFENKGKRTAKAISVITPVML